MTAALPLSVLPTDFPDLWACDWGEDRYGLWQSFRYKGAHQQLRWIEPGEFLMGSPKTERGRRDNETQHRVVITRGFWLADTTCTQALWWAVMGKNPSHFKGEDRPVENISWNDTQQFIERLNEIIPSGGFRLPTEAEWEYACRAGTTTPFWFGEQITPEQTNVNHTDELFNLSGETVPVKALPCNDWGLYQMHGNVWEWCQNWRGDYDLDVVADPTVPTTGAGRVLRGGSWVDVSEFARCASRDANSPGYRNLIYGLRLARGQTVEQ